MQGLEIVRQVRLRQGVATAFQRDWMLAPRFPQNEGLDRTVVVTLCDVRERLCWPMLYSDVLWLASYGRRLEPFASRGVGKDAWLRASCSRGFWKSGR